MRRIVVFALGVLAGLWLLAGPAAACDRAHTGTDWACLYVEHADTGACVQNPLPQESPLPVPEEVRLVPDEVPTVAPLVETVLPLIPDVKPEVPGTASVLATAGSLVPNPNSLVPGNDPVPNNPMALVPGMPTVPTEAPLPPYEPTGMPGTPI